MMKMDKFGEPTQYPSTSEYVLQIAHDSNRMVIRGIAKVNWSGDEALTRANQEVLVNIATSFFASCVAPMYRSACHCSGGYVKMQRRYKSLALLERKDKSPVFIYQLVQVLDELVDYDEIIAEYPGLSYSQVSGAMGFLRRIAQFNTAGVDVDQVEESHFAEDEELIASLRHAINQGEGKHVLVAPE